MPLGSKEYRWKPPWNVCRPLGPQRPLSSSVHSSEASEGTQRVVMNNILLLPPWFEEVACSYTKNITVSWLNFKNLSLSARHCFNNFQFSSVQSLSRVRLFATPWIAARQASLSITISQSSLRFTSIESVMPSSHLILGRPFSSCPQSLPASESFPMSQLFAWSGQSTGDSALASFLPKKHQSFQWTPRTDLL